MNTNEMKLDELPAHTCGVVLRIEATEENQVTLKTLGIHVGRKIELIQRGDPIIIRVFNSRLGLSKRLADHIIVEVCGPQHCVTPEFTDTKKV